MVTNVVDGDTFDATCDLGFRMYAEIRFRVSGIDTCEIYRPKSDEEFKKGLAAKRDAERLLMLGNVLIRSIKEEVYNRWAAIITLPDGRDFATEMIKLGHQKPTN